MTPGRLFFNQMGHRRLGNGSLRGARKLWKVSPIDAISMLLPKSCASKSAGTVLTLGDKLLGRLEGLALCVRRTPEIERRKRIVIIRKLRATQQ